MTYSNDWIRLREDLANPAELRQARSEAIRAVIAWARKWKEALRQLPDPQWRSWPMQSAPWSRPTAGR